MKIYDISLPITNKMLIWPKDPKPKVKIKTFSNQGGITLTKFSLTSHTGTHVEAPKHFFKKGRSVDNLDPEKLVGPCKVLDLTNFFRAKGPAEVGWAHFGTIKVRKGDRLLVKTGNYKFLEGKKFTPDYISVSQDGAKNLAKRQISLIGIDYLNIEKKNSQDNWVHKILLDAGIVIVEGLNLKDIAGGEYFLVCAPLKLEGADGAPSRVFLLKDL